MLSEQAERGELAAALAAAGGAWQRGWVLAAMGRYGDALRVLDQAMDGPERARALATRASILRQLALHRQAALDDDTALALDPPPEVRAGLLVGRVADALGLGLRDQWSVRLDQAAQAVHADGDWRQRVRLAWVSGETAMYRGDATAAAPHFAEAIARSIDRGARRHEAKSHLFLGAAHMALGNIAAARGHARAALTLAGDCGAQPLRWAAALVLAEAGERPAEHVALAREVLSGSLDGLPPDLREAALARDPARWLLAQAKSGGE